MLTKNLPLETLPPLAKNYLIFRTKLDIREDLERKKNIMNLYSHLTGAKGKKTMHQRDRKLGNLCPHHRPHHLLLISPRRLSIQIIKINLVTSSRMLYNSCRRVNLFKHPYEGKNVQFQTW